MQVKSIDEITAPKFLLATYPRSGTTWMLRTMTMLYSGQPGELNFDKNPYRIALNRPYYVSFPNPPVNKFTVVKTHKSRTEFESVSMDLPTVYVRRDCRDAMLSYYFWTQPRLWGRSDEELVFDSNEFSKFLEEKIPEWIHHINSWRHYGATSNFCEVSYEDMKSDYVGTLERLIAFIGKSPTTSIEFCREHLVEKQEFGNSPSAFYRKGIIGDWENYYTKEHVDFVKNLAGPLMRQLGYSI